MPVSSGPHAPVTEVAGKRAERRRENLVLVLLNHNDFVTAR
jgi:hypothetical protein